MTAQDYAISFPYGATDPPYGTPELPFHRGDDRPCPSGTPVVVQEVTIGYTGATGLVTGPHLHIQEWQGDVKNTRKPQNAFAGGTVTNVGTASQWGNFVTITSGGWNTTYCHLSSCSVSKGAAISTQTNTPQGGISVDTIKSMYWRLLGRQADQDGINHYTQEAQKNGFEFIYNDLKNSAEGQADWDRRNPDRVAELERQVLEFTNKNVDLSNKLQQQEVNYTQQIANLREEYEQKLVEAQGKTVYVENPETGKKLDAILKALASLKGMVANLFKKK